MGVGNMQVSPNSLIVVDDDVATAFMIEEILKELGWLVDGVVHTEPDAFNLLNTTNPKLALLDINLGTTTSLGVATSCRDRGIPVVIMTAYTSRDLPPQLGDAPVLAKPFSPGALHRTLQRALR